MYLQLYVNALLDFIEDAINRINSDLNKIMLWSENNHLILNPSKSQSIFIYTKCVNTDTFPSICLNNKIIPYSEKVRNLGIIFNKRMTWDDHLSIVSQKIYGTLRSLWDVTRFADMELRKKLFIAFIFPIFLYCDVVLFGMSKGCEKKLQLLFNACVRYIFKLRKFDHVSNFSKTVLNCDLQVYYKIRVLTLFYKIISTRSPNYLYEKLTFSQSTRNQNLIVPLNKSHNFNSSFFVKGAVLWNQLPCEFKEIGSAKKFKLNCFEYFSETD